MYLKFWLERITHFTVEQIRGGRVKLERERERERKKEREREREKKERKRD